MFQSIMLFIAAGCLLLNLFLTIIEIIKLYNATLYAANNRRNAAPITCQSGARVVELDGLKYNVDWIIKDGRYLYNEEKENKRS